MRRCSPFLTLAIAAAGCTAAIEPPEGAPNGGYGGGRGTASCNKLASVGTKLVRLTHAQYDNTVRDLFELDVRPSPSFQKDPTFQGFNNNAAGLKVADRLGRDYRRTAEELALQVVSTPAARAKVVPCSSSTDECASTFISTFGRRAFRRPLTAAENATYLALFKKAATLLDGADPFAKGVELVIEAMLQTPNFLYRVELAEAAPVGSVVPLTSYEVATRLSYMLWNTTPDNALLNLAESGMLTTPAQVKAQALKMLEDKRAEQIVDDFHYQWLDLDKYNNLTRDAVLYPNFSAALSPMMQQETLRFVREVVFGQKAPFATLFTAPYTFVNKELAAIYKVPGTFTSADYTRVELNPSERSGLLTQTGFLAAHAYTKSDSPIHRGVFMIRRVLCLPQGDPPPNADLKLPPLMGDIKTTRQQVAAHTSPAGCNSCHARINGIGFAFENYDAIGQYRTMDNGVAVDSTGTLALGDQSYPFKNAIEFGAAVSKTAEARSCYALNWLRYAYQRADSSEDACDVDAMTENLAKPGYSIKDMIADLTLNKSFLNRPVEELP
jgi:hypothetical protein